jgi:hypothetical protein
MAELTARTCSTKRLCEARADFDGNGGSFGGGCGDGAQLWFVLDRQHPHDRVRVVAEARPRAGADVDDLTGQAGEEILAVLGDPADFQRLAHRGEAKAPDVTQSQRRELARNADYERPS